MKNRVDDTFIADFLLSPRSRIYRHLLLQCVVVLITISVFWYEPFQAVGILQRLLGWVIYITTINFVIYTNVCWLVPRFLFKERYGLYLLAALGMIFLVIVITVVYQSVLYNSAMPNQYPGGFMMFINALSGVFTVGLLTAGTSAIMLLRYWIFHNQRIDELQSTTLHSGLKYFRNQINPHFLFNMLNNVDVLIKKDPAEASKVLFKLENLLRYQMNDSSREGVSLCTEIRFLSDYLNLEKIRRDKFEYTIVQEGEIDSVWLPPLLFIPFVENAVKHNSDSENPFYVHISFKVQDKYLEFRCSNSKPGVMAKDKREVGGIGLVNIRRRLALLYPGKYLMERKETKENYTVDLYLNL